MNKVDEFLLKYNHHPDQIDIDQLVDSFLSEMKKGLDNQPSSLAMIPTYLSTTGNVKVGEKAITIDAGGTNLRIATVQFDEKNCTISNFKKQAMFGLDRELSKQEFLDALTDLIMPLLAETTKIGFCFSFSAEITPDKDGIVLSMSKNVKVKDIVGTVLGKELKENIKARGFDKEVNFVILNDTVSTLLGGPTISEGEKADGQIGFILGTGINTAYSEKTSNIKKISSSEETMIINMESGDFNKLKQGHFDLIADQKSQKQGYHIFEKMISGVYLGNVITETIKQAAKEGLFSKDNTIDKLEHFSMSTVDSFMRAPFGNNPLANACGNYQDVDTLYQFCDKALARASKLVVSNLAACMVQMDGGKDICAPTRIVVEGSTFHKCYQYKEKIDYFMKQYVNEKLHRYYQFASGDDVNLIGSAEAAILNIK